MRLDALVVGAGPAGAVAAAMLAQHGARVAILTGDARRRSLGETLPGPALALLRSVGLEPSGDHLPLTGTVTDWGPTGPWHEDGLSGPFGRGLRLDREAFEAELLAAATSRGAVPIRSRRGVGPIRFLSGAHEVAAGGGFVEARWLLDATGRSAIVVRRAGVRRERAVPLFSVSAVLPAGAPSSRTVIEATPIGWWYATQIGGDRAVVSLQCDGGAAASLRTDPSAWLDLLGRARLVSPLVDAGRILPELAVCDASEVRSSERQGPGWIAIGDAAAAFDPVTSHGLYGAVRDGVDGAKAVVAALGGDENAVVAFERDRAERHAFVRRQAHVAYGRESRWPGADFWRRRREILVADRQAVKGALP